jgi:predicted Zn-dependent peptidase
MSLCYYASSAVEKHKGIMLVSSGVDPSNGETAKNEILRQLDAVKNGEIEDWELDGAKGTYVTLLRSYMDEPYGMENFYLDNCLTGLTVTPEEMAGLVDCVTKEEVVAAAGGIKADCVYFLTARESEKEPENEA